MKMIIENTRKSIARWHEMLETRDMSILNELLAEENPQHLFFNVGPGWVDSPIHKQTLAAFDSASAAYQETIRVDGTHA